MKTLLKLMALLCLLLSCQKEPNPYQLEDQFYDCIRKQEIEKGQNSEQAIASLEQVLIEHNALAGSTGADYLAFYQKIGSGNEAVKEIFTDDLTKSLLQESKGFTFALRCRDLGIFDSTTLVRSEMAKKMTVTDDIVAEGDFTLPVIARSLSTKLTAQDFEHILYKHYSLYWLMVNILPSQKSPNDWHTSPYQTEIEVEENLLHVLVTSDSRILVDGTEVPLAQVASIIRKFKLEGGLREELQLEDLGIETALLGSIKLDNESGASYQTYLKTYKSIISAVDGIKEEYAQRIYSKPLVDLDFKEHKNISTLIPIMIYEAEPKGSF